MGEERDASPLPLHCVERANTQPGLEQRRGLAHGTAGGLPLAGLVSACLTQNDLAPALDERPSTPAGVASRCAHEGVAERRASPGAGPRVALPAVRGRDASDERSDHGRAQASAPSTAVGSVPANGEVFAQPPPTGSPEAEPALVDLPSGCGDHHSRPTDSRSSSDMPKKWPVSWSRVVRISSR